MTEPYHLRSQLLGAKAAYEKAWETSDSETQKSLFNSMLFECSRARWIARDDPKLLEACSLDRKEFLAVMDAVANLRNVVEHWQDPKDPRPLDATQHRIGSLTVAVDEASFIILGPQTVLKGRLNLCDVYQFVCSALARFNETP